MVKSIQLLNVKYIRVVDTYDGYECIRLINAEYIVQVEFGDTAIVFVMVDGHSICYTDLTAKQLDDFHTLLGHYCL